MATKKISANTLDRLNASYTRVASQVDFSKMLTTSMIHVGVGASSTGIEQFSRLGAKRWVLFDQDVVERKNLVAQDFEISDIGKPKVQAMKERMERCEFEKDATDVPALNVSTYQDFLAMDDESLDALVEEEKKHYQQVILVMATDFHPAQARGARLGIRHGLNTFFIGAYRDGLAGEIIFWRPGTDNLPCYRCITASRYHAFDNRPVTAKTAAQSSGLPFAIGVLDSELAHLIIGCIHYETPGRTDELGRHTVQAVDSAKSMQNIRANPHADFYRDLLNEKRNFIQTQLNPAYRMAGEDIFHDENGVHGPNVKTFVSMFQADQTNPLCPDCAEPRAWTCTDYRLEVSSA